MKHCKSTTKKQVTVSIYSNVTKTFLGVLKVSIDDTIYLRILAIRNYGLINFFEGAASASNTSYIPGSKQLEIHAFLLDRWGVVAHW